jgi:hypothetical protein
MTRILDETCLKNVKHRPSRRVVIEVKTKEAPPSE